MNISYPLMLKNKHVLHCHWTFNHDFVPPCSGHFENTGSLIHVVLQMLTHFIIQYKKSHWLITSPISSGKSSSAGKFSTSQYQIQVFQNSHFCLKTYMLSLATNNVHCFTRSDRLTSFSRIYLPSTKI